MESRKLADGQSPVDSSEGHRLRRAGLCLLRRRLLLYRRRRVLAQVSQLRDAERTLVQMGQAFDSAQSALRGCTDHPDQDTMVDPVDRALGRHPKTGEPLEQFEFDPSNGFSVLFAGHTDLRHFFITIVDLHKRLRGGAARGPALRKQSTKLQFLLNDHCPYVSARAVVLLALVAELGRLRDGVGPPPCWVKSAEQEGDSQSSPSTSSEDVVDGVVYFPFEDPARPPEQRGSFLCVLLQYILFAGSMPPWVHWPLVKIVERLKEQTTLASVVPWASCDRQTWRAVQDTFQYMLDRNVFRRGNMFTFGPCGESLSGYRDASTKLPLSPEAYNGPKDYHMLFDFDDISNSLRDQDNHVSPSIRTELMEKRGMAEVRQETIEMSRRAIREQVEAKDRKHFENLCRTHGVRGGSQTDRLERLVDLLTERETEPTRQEARVHEAGGNCFLSESSCLELDVFQRDLGMLLPPGEVCAHVPELESATQLSYNEGCAGIAPERRPLQSRINKIIEDQNKALDKTASLLTGTSRFCEPASAWGDTLGRGWRHNFLLFDVSHNHSVHPCPVKSAHWIQGFFGQTERDLNAEIPIYGRPFSDTKNTMGRSFDSEGAQHRHVFGTSMRQEERSIPCRGSEPEELFDWTSHLFNSVADAIAGLYAGHQEKFQVQLHHGDVVDFMEDCLQSRAEMRVDQAQSSEEGKGWLLFL